MVEEQKHLFFQVFILVCDKFKTKNSGINHYFKNNIKDITKKSTPRIIVNLVTTSSNPLSFWCPNKFSFPPVIIEPASLALFPCKRTIAINNTELK